MKTRDREPEAVDEVVAGAWHALASAQDALLQARALAAAARATRERLAEVRLETRAQRERARHHARQIAQQIERLRLRAARLGSSVRGGPED
jgi:hypothetical protein